MSQITAESKINVQKRVVSKKKKKNNRNISAFIRTENFVY